MSLNIFQRAMRTMNHIWDDAERKRLLTQVDGLRHDEFAYPLWMFALNIAAVVAFSAAVVYIFVKYWKPNVWPFAIIFIAFAAPVWRNLYRIYRGPRCWVVDMQSDLLEVERFDGTKEAWRLSTLRRMPKTRLGRPYKIVDDRGNLVFDIWMYVSRYEELAKLITPQIPE